jgi:sulfite reductase alpha subunit-like flavoprotein
VLAGKPCATLGFGSSQYPRFCGAANTLAAAASAAGAQSLLHVGKCDAEGDQEADFRPWAGELLERLAGKGLVATAQLTVLRALVSPLEGTTAAAGTCPPVFNVVPMPGLRAIQKDASRCIARVLSVTQLIESAAAIQEGSSTVCVRLDLSQLPHLSCAPGDHIKVFPTAAPDVRRPRHLQLRAHAPRRRQPSDLSKHLPLCTVMATLHL